MGFNKLHLYSNCTHIQDLNWKFIMLFNLVSQINVCCFKDF